MPKIFAFALALVLLAAGLVFATSAAIVLAVLFGAWKLRGVWSRLTGRRASGIPREEDGPMGPPSRVPGAYTARLRRIGAGEVTDVHSK